MGVESFMEKTLRHWCMDGHPPVDKDCESYPVKGLDEVMSVMRIENIFLDSDSYEWGEVSRSGELVSVTRHVVILDWDAVTDDGVVECRIPVKLDDFVPLFSDVSLSVGDPLSSALTSMVMDSSPVDMVHGSRRDDPDSLSLFIAEIMSLRGELCDGVVGQVSLHESSYQRNEEVYPENWDVVDYPLIGVSVVVTDGERSRDLEFSADLEEFCRVVTKYHPSMF